jgi:6-methylsalicylate decarboxylase
MTYDFHRHLWPEPLLELLRSRTEPPFLRGWSLVLADGEFEVEEDSYGMLRCLNGLDRDGIDVAVVSCPPTLGIETLDDSEPLLDAYHQGVRDAVASSDGRLLAFSMGRPEPGFIGTTVSADALLDLDALAPVLDELQRDGKILFVHPGPARGTGWWAAVVGYTSQMQAAYATWLSEGVERWPELRVLFAILAGGAPVQLERLHSRGFDTRRALRSNLYLDTASYGRRAIELCLATYGGRALVFGSDEPVIDSRPTLEAVRGFGHAVAETICGSNPGELLSCR